MTLFLLKKKKVLMTKSSINDYNPTERNVNVFHVHIIAFGSGVCVGVRYKTFLDPPRACRTWPYFAWFLSRFPKFWCRRSVWSCVDCAQGWLAVRRGVQWLRRWRWLSEVKSSIGFAPACCGWNRVTYIPHFRVWFGTRNSCYWWQQTRRCGSRISIRWWICRDNHPWVANKSKHDHQ